MTVADSGAGKFSVTDTSTGNVDLYNYDSAAQTLSIVHNDSTGTAIAPQQDFIGITGLKTPWVAQQAASPTNWNVTPNPVGLTDGGGGTLLDTNGVAAPNYTNPVTITNAGNGQFSVTDNTTGYVDQYSYDSVGQTLSITHNDNANNPLGTQNFTGITGIAGLGGISTASLPPSGPTTWDVFNKTTQHSTLTSSSSYATSYDTSNFDITNPATSVTIAGAYTSTTSFSYTNVNVNNPTLMQSALPNLKLNYVVTPKITVTSVTDVPMPTSLQSAQEPYDINTKTMEQWQKDAMGFMKAGTPFMINFDQQGHMVAQQLTGDNVVKFNNPTAGTGGYNPNAQTASYNPYSGVASLLSTIA